MKKEKASPKKKSAKAQLAKGAEEIRKLQRDGKKPVVPKLELEPVVIPESTRDIKDILAERVTVLPGSIGLKIADDMPIEENLRVLDWATTLSDHVGFMIGDVINAGQCAWGSKYDEAVVRTGRARDTLRTYASVALRIAPEYRKATLTFGHHREIARLYPPIPKLGEVDCVDGDTNKMIEVLEEVAAQAEKGKLPTTKEVRIKVSKLKPSKVKKPTKVTSGKSKKKNDKPLPPPYEPSAEEQSKLDATEDALVTVNQDIKSSGVVDIICKLDTKQKTRWMRMLLEPLVGMYNKIHRCTGY